MRKLSQREALRRALQKAVDNAEKASLGAVAEVLAKGCTYSDERDEILVIMADADITSIAFPSEQACARAERDRRRSVHQTGVTIRNEVEAGIGASQTGHNHTIPNVGPESHDIIGTA